MRRILAVSAITLLGSLLFGATTVESVATGHRQVQVDGSATDWSDVRLFPLESTVARVGMQHDSSYIYILVALDSPDALSEIQDTGITLWVNHRGKTRKVDGVRFKMVTVTADQLIGMLTRQGRNLTSGQQARIRQKPSYLLHQSVLVDRTGREASLAGTPPEALPVFRSRSTGQGLSLEFRIPYNGSGPVEFLSRLSPDQTFALGFEWGGLSEAQRQELLRTQYQNTEDPKTCSQDDCLPGEERPMFRRKVGKAVGTGDRKSFWITSTLDRE